MSEPECRCRTNENRCKPTMWIKYNYCHKPGHCCYCCDRKHECNYVPCDTPHKDERS